MTKWIRSKEAAAILGWTTWKLYRMARTVGGPTGYQPRRRGLVFFDKDELIEWKEQNPQA